MRETYGPSPFVRRLTLEVTMIATLIRVLLLTLIWGALQGSFGIGTLLLGAVFSWAVLRLSRPLFAAEHELSPEEGFFVEAGGPIRRTWRSLVLLVVFLRELVFSAFQVAWYVIQPRLRIRPAIIEYPLDVQTDREITVLANMISLTPGTLSMDVAPDRSAIYVHAISVSTRDGQEVIDDIKGSLEKHIHRALGPMA